MNSEIRCLDISRDRCPMSFIKAKMQLESLQSGQRLLLTCRDQEVAASLVDSLKDLGESMEIIAQADSEQVILHLKRR